MTVYDARHNTAKSKQQYVASWNAYIDELHRLLSGSGIPESEWPLILLPLRNAVTSTADDFEAGGHFTE